MRVIQLGPWAIAMTSNGSLGVNPTEGELSNNLYTTGAWGSASSVAKRARVSDFMIVPPHDAFQIGNFKFQESVSSFFNVFYYQCRFGCKSSQDLVYDELRIAMCFQIWHLKSFLRPEAIQKCLIL